MSTPTDPTPAPEPEENDPDPATVAENAQSTANEGNNIPNPDPADVAQVVIPQAPEPES